MSASTTDLVFDFIDHYYADHRVPPTFREIAEGVEIPSLSSVHYHVNKLVDDGRCTFVSPVDRRSRNVIPSSRFA